MRTFECTWRVIVNVTIRWRGVCTGLPTHFAWRHFALGISLWNVHHTRHMLRHVTPMKFSAFSVVRNKRQETSDLSTDIYKKYISFYTKSMTACYHSVLNHLSCNLLSQNLKIKIHRTIILPVVLCGSEIGRSHRGRSVGWWFLRIGYWGEYLGLR